MNNEDVSIEFQGRTIRFTWNGYLKNFDDWSEDLVRYLSEKDGIKLSEDHWEVIRFMREYYSRHKVAPMPRVIVKRLNETRQTDRFGIKYIYELFPPTPLRHACRYAGLPEPEGCI